MSLKRLSTVEMIQISSPWITAGDPANAVIASNQTLVGVLPALTEGCEALYALLPRERDGRSEELGARARELDAQHDERVRVLYGALGQMAVTEEDGEALLAIRELLFPQGLQHTQLSYRAQSGHAKLVEAHMTQQQWERLGAAQFGRSTVRALTERWISVANELGDIEQQRARLRPLEQESPANANAARFRWIRAVNALIAMAALAELNEADDHLLFNELRVVEAAADSRARRTSAGAVEPDEQESTVDDEPSAPPAASPETTALGPTTTPTAEAAI